MPPAELTATVTISSKLRFATTPQHTRREATMPNTTSPPSRSHLHVVIASMMGTTVEWYDFFLYGVCSAIIFPQMFFPASDPAAGTMLSLATFAVGFIARPLGGFVFGHFGDLVGRKQVLVASLLMAGASTFAIGLLPGYQTIGVTAPILLVALRLIQGFAVGGEWGGAILIVSESGDSKRRGFWTSWPQAGAPAGQLLANGLLALLALVQSEETFTAWGWRVPFLLSAVLIVIGLYVRLTVEESPLFRAAQARAAERKATSGPRLPVIEVFRRYPRELLTIIGARLAENVSYYVFTVVISTYMKITFGVPSSFVLGAVLIGTVVHLAAMVFWGAVSDRIGRRPVYIIGAVGVGSWVFAFFALLNQQSFGLTVVAVAVALFLQGAMYGPQAAMLSEMFDTRIRYSGMSIGYNLAAVAAGGLAPIISLALLDNFHSGYSVALYVAICAILTVTAVVSYHETKGRNLADADADESVAQADNTPATQAYEKP